MTEHREQDAQDDAGRGRAGQSGAEQQFHKISSRVRRLRLRLKADAWNSAMTSGIN